MHHPLYTDLNNTIKEQENKIKKRFIMETDQISKNIKGQENMSNTHDDWCGKGSFTHK